MAYQLGYPRLRKFKKMRKAVQNKEWALAEIEALNSQWARQTPGRAQVVAARVADRELPA